MVFGGDGWWCVGGFVFGWVWDVGLDGRVGRIRVVKVFFYFF